MDEETTELLQRAEQIIAGPGVADEIDLLGPIVDLWGWEWTFLALITAANRRKDGRILGVLRCAVEFLGMENIS